jgi:hypothetical protein
MLRPIAALPLALKCSLLVGPPADLSLDPPIGSSTLAKLPLFGPEPPLRLSELFLHLGPGEIAAERRVRHLVVAGEIAQRLASRASPNQRLVGDEPAQPTAAFHDKILAFQ